MPSIKPAPTLLLLVLALSSCTTPAPLPPAQTPVEVPAARLQPPPASVMVERKADFRQRLLNFFSPSSTTPIP